MYTGISNSDEQQKNTIELALVRDFIIDNYGFLTIDEVELAYTLAITQKLSDCDYYGNFSPLYVGKVLNSYLYYRKIQLADVIRKKEKSDLLQQEVKNKPTPEEEANLTKEIFLDFYNQNKEKNKIDDVFNICWNFIRKQLKNGNNDFLNKWTNPQKKEYDEAMNYAVEEIRNKETNIKNYFKSTNKDEEIKKIARNYCISKYLESVNIDELINKIKPSLFK